MFAEVPESSFFQGKTGLIEYSGGFELVFPAVEVFNPVCLCSFVDFHAGFCRGLGVPLTPDNFGYP